jgi:hypothetical protein
MKKMFKSLVIGLAIVGLIASTGYARGGYNESVVGGGDIQFNGATIPNGAAGGISGSGGFSAAQSAGGGWGRVGGDISIAAGGVTDTTSGTYVNNHRGYTEIGVYSRSENLATTNGFTTINGQGAVVAESTMIGGAAEGTLNGSVIGKSPRFFTTDGVSGGVAGQGAVGGFVGVSGLALEGDVSMRANLEFSGSSYSDSFRFVERDRQNGTKTEGMGTYVGANTNVRTDGWVDPNGFVEGGFVAAGGAASKTVQKSDTGFAKASTVGTYSGSGSLGDNYTGKANGYTKTSITQYRGMTGSIVTSSAGMHVVSTTSPVQHN